MPANTKHAEYVTHAGFWSRLRDCVAGEDAVKAKGARYLPVLAEGEDKEYEAYKTRATFYSATGRTVDGLQGAILRKPPKVEWPGTDKDKDRLKSIGRAGESFQHLSSVSVRENLVAGRFGLFVDAPEDEFAEYPSYVCVVNAENILNWRQETVNGKRVLSLVVIEETYEEVDPKDPYKLECKPQWRCLHLGYRPAYAPPANGRESFALADKFTNNDLAKPFYYQEVWRENPNKTSADKLILEKTIVPRKKTGRLWLEIPFTFANAAGNEPDPCVPPLNDLAIVNLSHFRTSADLEHGLHFTALPTAWFAGFDFDGEVHIGSTVAYSTAEANAKAGFLEFTGQGLSSLSEALDKKEKQMATLGSRMLEPQKAGQETAASIALRSAGEQSALSLIATSCSEAWTKALRWMHQWGEASDDKSEKILVQLNTEFTVVTLAAPEIAALVQAAQSGTMSWDTLFYNFQRGGLYPEGTDAKKERAKIEDEGLPGPLGLAVGGTPPLPDQGAGDPSADPAVDGVPPKDAGTGKGAPPPAK